MSRRTALFGAAVLAGYLVVAVATHIVSGRHVLPLFEGVGPPPAYQWVKPPPAFAAGNTKPHPASVDIAFSAGKSVQAAAGTFDGQFVVNFGAGAFPPNGADTNVRAVITPLDPATLGPVPAGLATDGNAYRIELTYRPSNTPVDAVAVAGDVVLSAPNLPKVLLYSSDGRSWSMLASQPVGGTSAVGAPFTRPGWYLAAASPTSGGAGGHGSGLGTLVIVALVFGLVILLVAVPEGIRVIRRRRSGRGSTPRRRAGPAPKRPTKPSRRR